METKIRKIDNRWDVKTYREEFGGISSLEVEVGTNGYHGGDAGHGSRTYLRIENTDCSCIEASVMQDDRGFEIILGGDSEMDTFIDALDFAVGILKKQAYGIDPKSMTGRTKQQVAFSCYLSDVISLYKLTNSLRGMSNIRQKHHVAGVTKEQFFELGLDELASRGIDVMSNPTFCDSVYEYILHHSQIIPKWE